MGRYGVGRAAALMRRGEVRLVDLEPAVGSEANKRRPAIVVSNDSANAAAVRLGRGVIAVVPITSNTSRVLPFQVLLSRGVSGLNHDSKAQAEKVRAVDLQRVGQRLSLLPESVMRDLDQALRLHLGL